MLTLRHLTDADLPLLLRLRAAAGWNQTPADLCRFLALSGAGSFVAEWDGQPAGTVCTFVFGTTAWIAMVLVEESLRGRGIGTALMRHAIDYLDSLGVERIRLDATPLGRPVYEKLGFVKEYDVHRYAGVVNGSFHGSDAFVQAADSAALERVIAFDTAAIGAERSAMLRQLFTETPIRIVEHGGDIHGYLAIRPGARAHQIGPCLAATDDAGKRLLNNAFLDMNGKPVYIDIPIASRTASIMADAVGLCVQRTLTRMCRGPLPGERTEMIWASSGPEKG